MSTALALRQDHSTAPHVPNALTLQDKIRYCDFLSKANMLPANYAGNPGNVLIALEFGEALAIPVIVAIMEIYVVKNRPSMSAKLMNALARRAGHRVIIDSQPDQATVQIVRRNDEGAYRVTFTMEQAKKAGITDKDTWRAYGPTMLVNRAISACCRIACPEVIMGLAYTPEELGDDGKVEVITGEIVEPLSVPPDENASKKAYNAIDVSEPQPAPAAPPKKPRATKAEKPAPAAQEQEQQTQAPANNPNDWDMSLPENDVSPASPEAVNDTWEAWKKAYGHDPETGEKMPGRAKEKFSEIFPGVSMGAASVAQVTAIQNHLAAMAATF